MDSFSSNYIKPRGSNLTNINASHITNKRQAQMVFTGYTRQVEAINQGFKTQRGAIAFNGSDGPAINNLKNGNTWTSPQTLNAIQTTNYCTDPNDCNYIHNPPNPCSTYIPVTVTFSNNGPSGALNNCYSYTFTNDSGILKLLTIIRQNTSSVVATLSNGDSYTPSPSSGLLSYSFI